MEKGISSSKKINDNKSKSKIVIIIVAIVLLTLTSLVLITSFIFGTGGNSPGGNIINDNKYGPYKVDEVGSHQQDAMFVAGKQLYYSKSGRVNESFTRSKGTKATFGTLYYDWVVEAYISGIEGEGYNAIPDIHIALEVSDFQWKEEVFSSSTYIIEEVKFDELFMEYTMGYNIEIFDQVDIVYELIYDLSVNGKRYSVIDGEKGELQYEEIEKIELAFIKSQEAYYPRHYLTQDVGKNVGFRSIDYSTGSPVIDYEEINEEFYEQWSDGHYSYVMEFHPELIDISDSDYLTMTK